MRRQIPVLVLALGVLSGGAAFADVLVETDEERIEAFADALVGRLDSSSIDAALEFVDPEVAAVEVRLGRETRLFSGGDHAALADLVRDEASTWLGSDVDRVQQVLEITGEHARLALRVRGRFGLVDATFDLEKVGGRWLVTRVRTAL